jgi:type II secretory pathway component GspD/PulD (secretin)
MGIFISVFFGLSFLMWFPIHHSLAAEGQLEADVFSIAVTDEPLREVFKKISKASGYEIRFNAQFGGKSVNVRLDDVTLQEAIARVLQAYNHVAVWDEKNKEIVLFIFNNKNLPVSITGTHRIFDQATETTSD